MIRQLDWRLSAALLVALSGSTLAADLNIEGTQAAAAEMPNVVVMLRRPDGVTSPDQLVPINVEQPDLIDPDIIRHEYAFTGHLDTGTSGVLISRNFYEILGVQQQLDSGGNPVSFYDVTVNGEAEFHVSEPLYVSVAPYAIFNEPEYNDLPALNQTFTPPVPIRAQLGLTLVDPGELGAEPRNVIGMPALIGKTMKVDATAYNHLDPASEEFPYLQTSVHAPNDPTLPKPDYTIKLSYGEFSQFTRLSPDEPGVEGPTLAHNPFIGPSPLSTGNDPNAPQGVTVKRGDASSTGTWLLDTGAQLSFMSSQQAAALNIGVFDLGGIPILYDLETDELIESQMWAGVGGTDPNTATLVPGFLLDVLELPGLEGSVRYHNVPIFVVDVTLTDALGNQLLLDGDIGMNLFLPSHDLSVENTVSSAFDYFVFDEPSGELRLTVTSVPEPASLSILAIGAGVALRRRRSRIIAA